MGCTASRSIFASRRAAHGRSTTVSEYAAGPEYEDCTQPRSAVLPVAERSHGQILVLFDVDGTLVVPSQKATDEMLDLLAKLRREYCVGLVGTGTYVHQQYQLGGFELCHRFDYVFSENGAHAFSQGREIHCHSVRSHLGEDNWTEFYAGLEQMLEDECEESARLLQLAKPGATLVERGTFIDVRNGVVNVCPIGRTPTLSSTERSAYEAADRDSGLRQRLLRRIQGEFGVATSFRITASIGGQIGIDCCPYGWEKTYCLQFVPEAQFPIVHFFGDKTHQGGNDYEIFTHARTIGHTVKGYQDTMKQIEQVLLPIASKGRMWAPRFQRRGPNEPAQV